MTEPRYLGALRRQARNPLVSVTVARETGAPLTVVQVAARLKQEAEEEAKRSRDDNLRFDQVWGVFDVDEHPEVDQARKLAEAKSVNLAISNPCFELWALLHFQDHHSYIERDRLRVLLKRHMPEYDKELDFSKMSPTYAEAVQRAKELDRLAEARGEPGCNPTTRVYVLTEAIISS